MLETKKFFATIYIKIMFKLWFWLIEFESYNRILFSKDLYRFYYIILHSEEQKEKEEIYLKCKIEAVYLHPHFGM